LREMPARLLALLAPDRRERLLQGPLARLTPNACVKRASVLEACAARGYALDEEEHTEGMSAVGVAFGDPFGRPVAVSSRCPARAPNVAA